MSRQFNKGGRLVQRIHALIDHEAIITTVPRAKGMRKQIDRLITYAKKGDLHNYRLAMEVLRHDKYCKKLFREIGPRFVGREGGYTRVLRVGTRKGDAAPLARIEFVEGPKAQPKRSKKPIKFEALERHAFYERKMREYGHELPDCVKDWEWRIPDSWINDLGLKNPPRTVCVSVEDHITESKTTQPKKAYPAAESESDMSGSDIEILKAEVVV